MSSQSEVTVTAAQETRSPHILVRVLSVLGFDPLTAFHFAVAFVLWCVARYWSNNSYVGAGLIGGLLPTQICLATQWATWSPERPLIRLTRLAWQLTVTYFLLLVVQVLTGPRQTALLWFYPLTMAPFILAAWLPAWIFRLFGWRFENSIAQPAPIGKQTQFQLTDAWRWTTQLCVLFAFMACFQESVVGWDTLGYVILGYFAASASAPAGIGVTLVLWLAMGERWSLSRQIIAGVLGLAWLFVTAAAARYALDSIENDGDVWCMVWIMSDVACVTTLATAVALRRNGWLMIRSVEPLPTSRVS